MKGTVLKGHLIFKRTLSDEELDTMFLYLAEKYDLQSVTTQAAPKDEAKRLQLETKLLLEAEENG